MAKVQVISAAYLSARRGRPRSAEAEAQISQFRESIGQLRTPDQAFLIALDESEKPATIRLRLLRAAKEERREIVVRRHPDGFVIGLMTEERRRRPRRATAGRRTNPTAGKVHIKILDNTDGLEK